jgi:hypothetical protein
LGEKNVFWFQIAVKDAKMVQIRDAGQDLRENAKSLAKAVQCEPGWYELAKRSLRFWHEVERECVRTYGDVSGASNRYDKRMSRPTGQLNLSREPFESSGVEISAVGRYVYLCDQVLTTHTDHERHSVPSLSQFSDNGISLLVTVWLQAASPKLANDTFTIHTSLL